MLLLEPHLREDLDNWECNQPNSPVCLGEGTVSCEVQLGNGDVEDQEGKTLWAKRNSRAIIQRLSGCILKDRLHVVCLAMERNIMIND